MQWWLAYTYVAFSLVAAPVGVATTIAAWKRRHRPGIFTFFCLIAVCSWWAVSGALSLIGPTQRVALFWQVPVRMAAVILLPAAIFAFALDYTGRRQWLQPRRFVWFLIIPAVSELFNWTPLSSLGVGDFAFVRIGIFFVRQEATTGAWFPIHQAYSYVLAAMSMVLMFLQIFSSRHFYRRQAIILFLGVVLVFAVNALSALAPVLWPDTSTPWFDWTEVSFAISGLAWSWALFRRQFLAVMPVALDAVFASMDDAVIVLDNEGRIIDLNPAASELFARARQKAVGARLSEISADFAVAVEHLREPRAEIALRDRVIELRVSPLAGSQDGSAGTLAVLRDITERAQMMKDLDAYARTVAHDLKNPLTVIIGFAGLLADSSIPFDDETRSSVSAIADIGHKMASIINELLLLANVRTVQEVRTTALDMAEIVAAVRKRLSDQIQRTQAEIIVPPAWPPAHGYAAWVEEIWANYLSNALKYGGTPPRAEMGASAETGAVRFWIRDNGAGLGEEAAAQLFREFSRLHPERATGHGLGLSIVLRIAKKLGGEAGVATEPGAGCTFWFTLPAA